MLKYVMNFFRRFTFHKFRFSAIPFWVGLLSLCGCAKLAHLQQLLTIKAYSDNKDMQEQFVLKQNERFDKLLEIAQQQGLEGYPTKTSFLKEFGPPVFTRKIIRQNKPLEEWLYRHATEYWDGAKVYLYFDDKDHLEDWEYVVPPKKNLTANTL